MANDGTSAGPATASSFDRVLPALHEPADHTEGRWRLRLRAYLGATGPSPAVAELSEEIVLDARRVLDPWAPTHGERQAQLLTLDELRWVHQQSGELLQQLEHEAAHAGAKER
jgi:hypothetical protein